MSKTASTTNNLLNLLNLIRVCGDIIKNDDIISTHFPEMRSYIKDRVNEIEDYLTSPETGLRLLCEWELNSNENNPLLARENVCQIYVESK